MVLFFFFFVQGSTGSCSSTASWVNSCEQRVHGSSTLKWTTSQLMQWKTTKLAIVCHNQFCWLTARHRTRSSLEIVLDFKFHLQTAKIDNVLDKATFSDSFEMGAVSKNGVYERKAHFANKTDCYVRKWFCWTFVLHRNRWEEVKDFSSKIKLGERQTLGLQKFANPPGICMRVDA